MPKSEWIHICEAARFRDSQLIQHKVPSELFDLKVALLDRFSSNCQTATDPTIETTISLIEWKAIQLDEIFTNFWGWPNFALRSVLDFERKVPKIQAELMKCIYSIG